MLLLTWPMGMLRFSLLLALAFAWFQLLTWFSTGSGLAHYPAILAIVIVLVFLSSIAVVFGAQWWVRRGLQPCLVDERDANSSLAAVFHILHRQSALLNISPPLLYIYESNGLNAFIVGGIWQQQHLYLSQRLLSELGHDEIEAVIAHEMAHIYYRDIVINETFYGMGMLGQSLLQHAFGILAAKQKGESRRHELVKQFAQGITYGVLLLPLWLLVLAYSRKSEYRADALASQLVGHERYLWLLYRLKGICRDNVFHLDRPPGLRDYFATHPPIHHRITALESRQHA